MNSGNVKNRKGEYRIDEMFKEIYETETMNMEDRSELLQEQLTGEEKGRILDIVLRKMEDRLQQEAEPVETEKGQPVRKENGQYASDRAAVRTWGLNRRILIASLVAVLAFATTAFAAEVFHWDTRLSNYFGIEGHNQQDLSGGGMNVGVSAENGGVTIEAVQTIGDGNNIYILLDATVPEGQRIYPESGFEMIYLQVDGVTSMGYSCDMLEDEDDNDNKATFLLSMEANKKINHKTISIRFSNLRHYIVGSGEMVVDTSGEWKLEWKLNYKDISRTYHLGETLTTEGGDVEIKAISISPIALNIEITGDYFEGYDAAPREPGEEDPVQVTGIRLEDGTVLTLEDASSWGCSVRGRECVLNIQMKKLLDVGQVESVMLNDKEFMISGQ